MSAASRLLVATSLLCLSVGSALATLPVTSKDPNMTHLEIVSGEWGTVTFRLLYPYDFANPVDFQARFGFKLYELDPAVEMHADSPFDLSITTCPSEAGVVCSEMTCRVKGDPKFHGERVYQVVYVLSPQPFRDNVTETQHFIIRIIDPPTPSEPVDTVEPVDTQPTMGTPSCPDSRETIEPSGGEGQAQPMNIPSSITTCTILIGLFLGLALVLSVAANVFLAFCYRRTEASESETVKAPDTHKIGEDQKSFE